MKLADKYSISGIDSHYMWIYEQHGKFAGINRSNNISGNKYYCFEGQNAGEGCQTVWYPNLKSARKVVEQYLNGHISHIPVKKC